MARRLEPDNASELESIPQILSARGVPAAYVPRLTRYVELLAEHNRSLNLTGTATVGALTEHVVDSLSLLPYVSGCLVDIGSGGGFPAIPVAIGSGGHVTLIEATAKKGVFLREALKVLKLEGEVFTGRAETFAREPALRERFDVATARAVAGITTVMELTLPFLRIGGKAVLQRGKLSEEEQNAASDAAPMLGARLADEVVLDGERRLVIFEKIEPTAQRFPRRVGIPQKRPLCIR